MRSTAQQKPSWLRIVARALRSSNDRHDLVFEFRRRRRGEPLLPAGPIRRVMVICQGNICRSPFAGRQLAAGCPQLEVRSAGLKAREGDPAQPGALKIGSEFGVDLTDHAAHRLSQEDIDWADLIIGMQGWHQASVRQRWPAGNAKVRLLGDFLPSAPHAVDDPWGGTDEFFRAFFEKISRANERLSALLNAREGRRPDTGR
jgi:protein-tyrosine phosphatase